MLCYSTIFFFRLDLSMADLTHMVGLTISYGEGLLSREPFIRDLGIGPISD